MNEQIKTLRVYISDEKSWHKLDVVMTVAETKINKTRHCEGSLCASIRLKCKNKFTIKKALLPTNHELSLQNFSETLGKN